MRISLQRLSKSFGGHGAVRDLTLEIAKGELLVLLGPSGCGKSTTLRMVAGLETPDSGDIQMDGRAVTHLPPRQRDLAMVFQSYALYPHLSVAENIAFPLRVRGVGAAEIGQRVADVARRLGLEALLARRPRQLSGGQRQRVALARAIIRQPNAFLMDEPLSNLDARLRVETRAELKHLQHELGATTVYVTHDQTEAMVLGHRIAVMNEGVLQQADTPAAVYERPANRFVAGFVGSPPMNFIDGVADAISGTFKADTLAIFVGREAAAKAATAGAAAFGVRPEHLTVLTRPTPGSVPARVYVSEPVGSDTYLVLQAGAHRLTARAQAGSAYTFDQAVWCTPDPHHLYFFTAAGQTIL